MMRKGITMDVKQCTKCKKHLAVKLFSKLSSSKDGYQRWCKLCSRESKRLWNKENQDAVSEYNREYKACNRQEIKEYNGSYYSERREQELDRVRKYQELNREKVLLGKRQYKKENKAHVAAENATRAARKLMATPPWMTVREFELIQSVYLFASSWSAATGVKHHVDHIIPLRGKKVCGLHVPWNLRIITATDNLKKGNRLDLDITLL